MGGVEHHCVRRRHQRGIGSAHVAGVARGDVTFDLVKRDVDPASRHFQPAATRTLCHAGGHKQFYWRFGRDHCADVAPVQHCAAFLRGKGALAFVERAAHRRVDRHAARIAADFF